MVDREARDVARKLFVPGSPQWKEVSDNIFDGFDLWWPFNSRDPAIKAMHRCAKDVLFSQHMWSVDGTENPYCLITRPYIPMSTAKFVTRCRAFLDSDLPYEWPSTFWEDVYWYPSFIRRIQGYSYSLAWEQWAATGDVQAWPFRYQADLMEAITTL
jgi:hypothetical protein